MRSLEQALLKKDVVQVEKAIAYAVPENIDINGICLMNVKDSLTFKNFSAVVLREQGFILTLGEWKKAVAQALESVHEDMNQRRILKRLHSGMRNVLVQWKEGTLSNAVLLQTLNQQSDAVLLNLWQTGQLPAAIQLIINTQLDNKINSVASQWFNGEGVSSHHLTHLDKVVKSALLAQWEDTAPLDITLLKPLEHNIRIALMEAFKKNNGLSPVVMTNLEKQVRDNLLDFMLTRNASKDYPATHLSVRIKTEEIVDGRMPILADYKQAVEEVLKAWHNDSLSDTAMKELTPFVNTLLMNLPISREIQYDLRGVAVDKLIQQLRAADYVLEDTVVFSDSGSKEAFSALLAYGETCIKQALNQEVNHDVSSLKQSLVERVLSELRTDWLQGEMDVEVSAYLEAHMHNDLKDQNAAIVDALYHVGLQEEVKELRKANADLLKQLQDLPALLTETVKAALSKMGHSVDAEELDSLDTLSRHPFFSPTRS